MVFLATVDAAGQPECTYKGGRPGFIRVLDDRTLILPFYDGNGLFSTLGNIRATGRVGLVLHRLRAAVPAAGQRHGPGRRA